MALVVELKSRTKPRPGPPRVADYSLFDDLQQQRVATRLIQRLRGRLSVPNPVTPV